MCTKNCVQCMLYSHLVEPSKLCIIKFMLLGILMCMYFYIQFTDNFWIPFENITTMWRKSLKDMYPLLSVSSILNMFSTKSEFGFTARAWANSSYWNKKQKQHRKLFKTVIAFFFLVSCISTNEIDLKLYKQVFCGELMKEV